MMRRSWTASVLWLALAGGLAGCEDDGQAASKDSGLEDSDAGKPRPKRQVVLGTPSPAGDLEFVRLEDGGDIALGTFGQGGTHATLAVRCIGFGTKAFVDVMLENLDSGETVRTLPSSRPQLLIPREEPEGAADMLPIYVMTGGLADPSEKDGLRIRVTADVRNPQGDEGRAVREGVLRKDF